LCAACIRALVGFFREWANPMLPVTQRRSSASDPDSEFMSRRTFTRLFRRETGLSLSLWR